MKSKRLATTLKHVYLFRRNTKSEYIYTIAIKALNFTQFYTVYLFNSIYIVCLPFICTHSSTLIVHVNYDWICSHCKNVHTYAHLYNKQLEIWFGFIEQYNFPKTLDCLPVISSTKNEKRKKIWIDFNNLSILAIYQSCHKIPIINIFPLHWNKYAMNEL